MRKLVLSMLASVCLLPAAASANYNPCDPWYLVAGANYDGIFHHGTVPFPEAAFVGDHSIHNNVGGHIYLGYQALPCVGVETGFIWFGTRTDTYDFSTLDAGPAGTVTSYRWSVPLRAKLSYSFLCDEFEVFALAGVHFYNHHITNVGTLDAGTPFSFADTNNGMDLTFGFGGQWNFTDSFGLRFAVNRYYYNRGDEYNDAVEGSIVWRF